MPAIGRDDGADALLESKLKIDSSKPGMLVKPAADRDEMSKFSKLLAPGKPCWKD